LLFGTVVFTMGEVTADDPWLAEVTIGTRQAPTGSRDRHVMRRAVAAARIP
jgi:hypothetical protein